MRRKLRMIAMSICVSALFSSTAFAGTVVQYGDGLAISNHTGELSYKVNKVAHCYEDGRSLESIADELLLNLQCSRSEGFSIEIGTRNSFQINDLMNYLVYTKFYSKDAGITYNCYQNGNVTLCVDEEVVTDLKSIDDECSDRYNELLNKVKKSGSDTDIMHSILDVVCSNVDYSTNVGDCSYPALREALLYGKTVCCGYTSLVYKLCESKGIECYYVMGCAGENFKEDETIDHAWNIVRLDNQWYLIDATWLDTSGNNSYVFNPNLNYERSSIKMY